MIRLNFLKKTGLFFLLFFLTSHFALATESILINFESNEIGKFPSGWATNDKKNALKIYSIQSEGDKKFLHADSKSSWAQIGFEKRWALKEFPILSWQWRAVLFPTNTNEHEKNRNDSVLGVYVVFGHWPFIKVIKYIWSDTLPVGASFISPYYRETKIIVVKSGRSDSGRWIREKRDVWQDYKLLYGEEEKNPIATGIAVLTDSDNTNSHAIGDYADFQISNSN